MADASAFPLPPATDAESRGAGMTMREWLAAMAMQGIIAGGMMAASPPLKPKEVAEGAFNMADAMLAQAKK